MSRRALAIASLLAVLASPMSQPAFAQDGTPIIVNASMARVLRLSGPASTIIVGNPGVADVTIQDPQTLVLTGRSFGRTNLIVLDSEGNPIADTLIEVVQLDARSMTVYQGMSRTTLSCTPKCHPSVTLGDDPGFSAETLSSSRLIESFAQ